MTQTQTQVIVGPEGPKNASIILVGEAPGANEVIQKRPFVGAAGRFLEVCLEKAGAKRKECYITNVVKIRPPANDINRLPELGTTVKDWIPSFKEELKSLTNPKVLIALGDTALNALCPGLKVTKWRGSVIECDWLPGVKVVPAYHPARVLVREYKTHPAFIHDLARAVHIAHYGWKELNRSAHIKPTFFEALDYIRRCQSAEAFAWDLETFGAQVACIGLALSETDSMCIPFKNGFANYWPADQEEALWRELGLMFSSPARKFVHNGIGFDHEFIREAFGAQPAPPVFDTYLAHALANPEMPHRLDFLTSMYTDLPYYKDDTKDESGEKFSRYGDRSYFEDLWVYNCKDAMVTFEVGQKLIRELKDLRMYEFFIGYVQPLYRCLFDIQYRGLPLDPQATQAKALELDSRIAESRQVMDRILGQNFNPASPKQVSKLLYETLGLPPQYKKNANGDRVLSVDESAITYLERLMSNPDLLPASARIKIATLGAGPELIRAFLDYRRATKLKSTYLSPTAITDWAWRTSYRTTETGRLSSRARHDGTGLNVQNIPPELRSLVKPRPGWKLMEVDLAQAEARAVAYLADCKPMIQEFNRPDGDVFKMIGGWVLNKPQNQVTKEERKLMKATVHGSNYLMGKNTFAEHLGIPVSEAVRVQTTYFQRFPEIKLWHESTRQELVKTGMLRTPFGRVRRFLGRLPHNPDVGYDTLKEAMAYRPQSLIVDYLNQALVKIHLWSLTTEGCEVISQNHDGMLIQYREDLERVVIEKVRAAFNKELRVGQSIVKFPYEIKVGPSWGELSPL